MTMTDAEAEPKAPSRLSASKVLGVIAGLAVVSTLALWWLGSLPEEPDFTVGRVVFGNIPELVVAMFYVIVAVFLGVSIGMFAQRARNWERGTWESRSGDYKRRLHRFLEGMSMRTVMEDRAAGMMHAMIYYGFIVLFIGTVILEIDHLLPVQFKFLHGVFYEGYSAVLDAAAVVYLTGIAWAVVRRYIVKPWRIRTKTRPEDAWILFVLAAIGITGLATEAARIALVGQPSFEKWSFLGYPLSFLIPQASASGVHLVFWISHVVAFVAFLVILPVTKLRHMVTTPADLALSARDRPKGAMREVPNLMEATDIESIGAATVAEFTWKQLFDTDACTICGRCTSVCPANITGKPLDPREIILKLGTVASMTATPPQSPPVGVDAAITVTSDNVFQLITPEELWSCTTCRACDQICPADIEIVDKILDMRRYLSLMEADF
ncbi:MAG: iron-sulfur protein, partial [Gammaproteobacteria bacterium]